MLRGLPEVKVTLAVSEESLKEASLSALSPSLPSLSLPLFFCLETGPHTVVLAGVKLTATLLPQPLERGDFRPVPQLSVTSAFVSAYLA